MGRRMMAVLLCVLLLLTMLPYSAVAVQNPEEDLRIRDQMAWVYSKSLESSGKESLAGYCGLMTSWQLYYLGITASRQGYHGKDHYDAYKDCVMTSGGYPAKAYDASQYTLEEALNAATRAGTQDVYNILVGFQWTKTEAGNQYGHALVIHAILDGMVYFIEGYGTPFSYTPGGACVCTMAEFAAYFDPWTQFEGIVVFGNRSYVDQCEVYGTDMFIELTEPAHLLDLPGGDTAVQLRQPGAGERLRATGVYQNTDGDIYYQVMDGDRVCYVSSVYTKKAWFNSTDATVSEPVIPTALEEGQKGRVSGRINVTNAQLGAVYVIVKDSKGEVIIYQDFPQSGNLFDLGTDQVNSAADLSILPKGVYTYTLSVDVLCYYAEDNALQTYGQNVVLKNTQLQIGTDAQVAEVTAEEIVKDGWVFEGDKLFYYVLGQPMKGWFCENGVDYYLREDGSAAVGWTRINGKNRYFSSTGAMRVGWLETEDATYYMLTNGVPSVGWKTIAEKTYYFDAEGRMQRDCWIEDEHGRCYITPDGTLDERSVDHTR